MYGTDKAAMPWGWEGNSGLYHSAWHKSHHEFRLTADSRPMNGDEHHRQAPSLSLSLFVLTAIFQMNLR